MVCSQYLQIEKNAVAQNETSTAAQLAKSLSPREEKHVKRAQKRAAAAHALANLHALQQAEKRAAFNAKYNDGRPVKIELTVCAGRKLEKREFIIDNFIEVRHKLEGIVLVDMSHLSGHTGEKSTYAIKKDAIQFYTGSIPEYLFDLPKRTRQMPEFVGTNDLRRETFEA